jgi:pantoate--beta-alanine ligase
VREPDGLALSSRNRRLSAEERRLALALIGALEVAARAIAAGERDARVVKEAAVASIPLHPAVRLEYLEIVHPDDMQPVSRIAGPVRIAGAMWVGNTRLIDNLPGDRD